jgi:tetratricopeptide (TPR) repeat protein
MIPAVALCALIAVSSNAAEEKETPSGGDMFHQALQRQRALVRRAWEAESAGGTDRALGLYRRAAEMAVPGESREYAWFGIGRCEARRGRLWSAFEALERSFPPTYVSGEVERRVALQMRIGRALMALGTEPVPDLPDGEKSLSGLAAASRVFQRVVYNHPNSREAAEALLLRGDCLRAVGDRSEAEIAYRRAIRRRETWSGGWVATAALAELLIRAAPEGPGRAEALDEAEALLESAGSVPRPPEALATRLRSARALLRETRAADGLARALFYLERGGGRHRQAAVFSLREVIRRFPGTEAADTAAQRLGDLGVAPEPDPAPETEGTDE